LTFGIGGRGELLRKKRRIRDLACKEKRRGKRERRVVGKSFYRGKVGG